MLEALVLLTQLATAPQGPPPLDPNGIYTTSTVKLDAERYVVLTLDKNGRAIRAGLRRYDGKQMTCPTFWAWIQSTYTCSGAWCGSTYTASGDEGSNVNRYTACSAARDELCASAFAQCASVSGSYMFCSLNYSYSGWNGYTGACDYWELRDCPVADDCSVE
jgi:hypothetical protein